MKSRIQHRARVMTLLAIAILGVVFLPASSQVSTTPTTTTMKLQGLDGRVYDMNDLSGNVVLVSF
ncbi:MAG TPA: hypothetical protein VF333_00535, partial [Pyrinomonadaceae bacterium]